MKSETTTTPTQLAAGIIRGYEGRTFEKLEHEITEAYLTVRELKGNAAYPVSTIESIEKKLIRLARLNALQSPSEVIKLPKSRYGETPIALDNYRAVLPHLDRFATKYGLSEHPALAELIREMRALLNELIAIDSN